MVIYRYTKARTSQHRRSELLQRKNKFDKKTKEALNSPQQLVLSYHQLRPLKLQRKTFAKSV